MGDDLEYVVGYWEVGDGAGVLGGLLDVHCFVVGVLGFEDVGGVGVKVLEHQPPPLINQEAGKPLDLMLLFELLLPLHYLFPIVPPNHPLLLTAPRFR